MMKPKIAVETRGSIGFQFHFRPSRDMSSRKRALGWLMFCGVVGKLIVFMALLQFYNKLSEDDMRVSRFDEKESLKSMVTVHLIVKP
jgi:hypothetical protein